MVVEDVGVEEGAPAGGSPAAAHAGCAVEEGAVVRVCAVGS